MSKPFKDISGQKFGRLTALYRLHNYHDRKNGVYWLCVCDCGNLKEVTSGDLIKNKVKSCGCLIHDMLLKRNTTHGKAKCKLYKIYQNILYRCYNKNCKHYKHYGGRGIAVCSEWKDDFMSFYDWSINNSYKEGLTIDRIDVNGNYKPNNCRWITNKQQTRNRRNTKCITYKGESKPLAEWCEIYNINYNKVYSRLYRNWSIEKALELEV